MSRRRKKCHVDVVKEIFRENLFLMQKITSIQCEEVLERNGVYKSDSSLAHETRLTRDMETSKRCYS